MRTERNKIAGERYAGKKRPGENHRFCDGGWRGFASAAADDGSLQTGGTVRQPLPDRGFCSHQPGELRHSFNLSSGAIQAAVSHRAYPQGMDGFHAILRTVRDGGAATDDKGPYAVRRHGGCGISEPEPDGDAPTGSGGGIRCGSYLSHGHQADGALSPGKRCGYQRGCTSRAAGTSFKLRHYRS